jgi:hypothetical protein
MYDIQAAAYTVLYELTSQKFMRLQRQSFFLQETKLAAAAVERTSLASHGRPDTHLLRVVLGAAWQLQGEHLFSTIFFSCSCNSFCYQINSESW